MKMLGAPSESLLRRVLGWPCDGQKRLLGLSGSLEHGLFLFRFVCFFSVAFCVCVDGNYSGGRGHPNHFTALFVVQIHASPKQNIVTEHLL